MVEYNSHTNRRSVLKKATAIVTATSVAGCSGSGDGGDGGDEANDGNSGSDGKQTTNETGSETFTNEAGVEVGATPEAIKELAEEEGGTVLYSTADREVVSKWNELIQETYPWFSVSTISGSTQEILPRWLAEYQADNINADFMISSSGTGVVTDRNQAMELSGDFMPNYEDLPDKFKTEYFMGLRHTVGCLQFNRNMTTQDAVKSWDDLVTSSEWSDGKIGWDPSPSYRLLYGLIEHKGGHGSDEAYKFLENLKAQEPTWVDSHSGLSRRCAAGNYPITFSHLDELGEQPEYPVDMYDDVQMFSAANGAVINNKANNPNSAILFSDWLYSDTAQKKMAEDDVSIKFGMTEFPDYIDFDVEDKDLEVILPDVDTDPSVEMWDEVMGELSAY